MAPILEEARKAYHAHLLAEILTRSESGVASNADKDSTESKEIASGMLARLGGAKTSEKRSGQTAGRKFEEITHSFLKNTLPHFVHLRPGKWVVEHVTSRSGIAQIARFAQYAHLKAVEKAAHADPELAIAIGNDYVIAPDVIVYRTPLSDAEINADADLVGDTGGARSALRARASSLPFLHANISCKWTIRSDRSQNSRSEAINLIRNRKGHVPHIAVVTAEPVPARIASIAMGTGDIDCVYHAALPELAESTQQFGSSDSKSTLQMLIDGHRLRDISDLPLDLLI